MPAGPKPPAEARLRAFASAAAILLVAGCQTNSYVDANYLYLRDDPGYPRSGMPAAFRKALASGQPVVLFVHGRGNEPKKSLQGMGFLSLSADMEGLAVSKLEKHHVKVILFSWDSMRNRGLLELDFYDRQRPLRNSDKAAERFAEVVAALASVGPVRPRMVLVAHSMGTIVVEKYARANGAFPRGMFSNVLLSSADADNLGHERWVQTLTETARVYVTVNEHDWILNGATDARDAKIKSLGRDPGSTLAPAAIYVRLSDTTHGMPKLTAHEAFDRGDGWKEFAYVRDFYATVLRGEELDLGNSKRIGVVKGNLYRLLP